MTERTALGPLITQPRSQSDMVRVDQGNNRDRWLPGATIAFSEPRLEDFPHDPYLNRLIVNTEVLAEVVYAASPFTPLQVRRCSVDGEAGPASVGVIQHGVDSLQQPRLQIRPVRYIQSKLDDDGHEQMYYKEDKQGTHRQFLTGGQRMHGSVPGSSCLLRRGHTVMHGSSCLLSCRAALKMTVL